MLKIKQRNENQTKIKKNMESGFIGERTMRNSIVLNTFDSEEAVGGNVA